MIDNLTIEKIRDTAQILDVVQEFVSLRRRGVNYVGLCPFHNDRNPSFYVSPAKNICNCFVCHTGGDPIHFLMKHEQMSYIEAVRWLAEYYHIPIEEKKRTAEEIAAEQRRESLFNLNEFAARTFATQLYETDEGRNIGLTYFYERGFQDKTIKKFGLGYALEEKQAFSTWALKNGHKRELLTDVGGTGLCYGGENERLTDRFRGRVIFPIKSLSGKVVGFGGRVLLRTSHTAMKYVNSPESEIYHKSHVLYGIYEAKNAIARERKCYLVEGYTDVLSMHQAGIENVVASSGTALTEGQIRLIKRFTGNITVLYDGDDAGINASIRGIDLLLKEGMNVKVLLLPDGEDPDSFARSHNAEELKEFISAHETDFIRFKASIKLKDATDPQKRAQATKELVRSIAFVPDPILAEIYIRETSFMLNVSETNLSRAVQAEKRQIAIEQQREQTREANQIAARERRASEEREEREEQSAKSIEESGEITEEKPTAIANGHSSEAPQPSAIAMSHSSEAPQPSAIAMSHSGEAPQPLNLSTPQPTDRYERNILRNVVRYGGETFTLTWKDEHQNDCSETFRVIDYIYDTLDFYKITFRHPLYHRMLQLAFDATGDPTVPFDSTRFFASQADEEISKTAQELLADRYSILDIQTDDRLEVIIPRCLLEMQNAIISQEIKHLQERLQHSQPSEVIEIMKLLQEKMQNRSVIEKQLGERVISARV